MPDLIPPVLARLWRDDRAAVSPMSVILTTTILSLGAIVGLATIRDHISQQYGDVAVALRSLRQTYSYTVGVDVDGDGLLTPMTVDIILTGGFTDAVDLQDLPDTAPACLNLTIAPINES